MLKFLLSRIAQAVPVLLVVVTATFFIVHAAPGGPFSADKAVPPEVIEALEAQYKLDQPVWRQYISYLGDILSGDFGPSFKYPGRSVNELIMAGIPITAELAFYAMLVALGIGILSGVGAAMRPNTLQDYAPMTLAMIGICMPSFLLGPLLVLVFGIELEMVPVSGWGDIPGDKILPSITLGTGYAAYMLEILSQDFIRTARAKGLSESTVIIKHALKGGLIPVIAFLGPAFAGLLAGSFVVETIFQIPGIGRFYVQAAFNRDYTLILGMTIFLSTLIIIFNLISDLISIWLNPKLRDEISNG